MFPVHVAACVLTITALGQLLARVDAAGLQRALGPSAPRRPAAGVLVFVALALVGSEVPQLASAIAGGTEPELIRRSEGLGNFVYVFDLGFVAPLSVLGAVWLWRGRPGACSCFLPFAPLLGAVLRRRPALMPVLMGVHALMDASAASYVLTASLP